MIVDVALPRRFFCTLPALNFFDVEFGIAAASGSSISMDVSDGRSAATYLSL